jgi:hypothetical protein
MKKNNPTVRPYGRFLLTAALAVLTTATARADYHSTVLGDKPVAYYPVNLSVDPTGTTATDLSGNGNNGTYNGTDPEYNTVPGPSLYIPNALYFDGFTSFVDLNTGSNPGLLNFSGPITLEAWVQPANTTEGPANIIAKGYESSVNSEITLRANAGNYFGGSYDGNGHGASGGQQTTNWAYVVISYNGTNWSIYVNSIPQPSNADTVGSINFSSPWRIGTGSGDYGSSRYFSGNLSEVAMYTNGLTAAQVLKHYYSAMLNSDPAVSRPIIVTQPQPQSTYVGGSVTFSVTAVSGLPTTNQWYKAGVPMPDKTNTTLTISGVNAGDAVNYSVVVGNSNGTTNSAVVGLSLFTPANVRWSASSNSGVWDTSSSANWVNLANSSASVFNPGDQVLFDDTANVPNNVTINGTISPSLITVNSSTNNFTFAQGSSPSLSGSGGLIKDGSSTLSVFTPAGFAGSVSVRGGSIYAGNNSFQSIGSITVTNNATLDLAGGSTSGGQTVTISGSGVGGVGALYNSYPDGNSELYNIALAADATIGCAGGAVWGLQGGSTVSGNHKLTINWGSSGDYTEWNNVSFANSLGDIELANGKLGIKNMGSQFGNPASTFTVDAGSELDFWTSDFGYAKNYHIFGKYQILTGFTTLNASYVLEDGCQFVGLYGNGDQTITGPVTLNGVAHFVLGDGNFIFTNVMSGPGGFLWNAYNHQLILQSSNTYTGPTIIGGGQQILTLVGNGSISHSSLIFFGGRVGNSTNTTIDVTGRVDQTLTLASGQTLAGIGGVNGSLTVSPGAILSPAGTNITIGITNGTNPVGTIAVANAIALNGTTTLKLNGSGVNDQVQAGGGITYGGTLNLVNISGVPLASGDSFQLFSAASYSGSFGSIIPATPGAGLAWDLSQLNSGLVKVVASGSGPVIGSTTVSGGNVIFSGTGGPANSSYAVLTSTNLATPIISWTPVATNNFDGAGNFSATNMIAPGTPKLFYRIKQLP